MSIWPAYIGVFFLGAMTWSFMEYIIHRFLGHDRRFRPNRFAEEHLPHHSKGDYFAPTWKKFGAAVLVFPVAFSPVYLLAGLEYGLLYASGLVVAYSFYEILHRLEHIHAGFGPYGRWARRHHFYHHFGNPAMNHGVTSPIWDIVFRTYHKPDEVIAVPDKLKMRWLTDRTTGEVYSRLQPYYSVRARQ